MEPHSGYSDSCPRRAVAVGVETLKPYLATVYVAIAEFSAIENP
jgi:hypothetical protein